jgi:hypothetical protein
MRIRDLSNTRLGLTPEGIDDAGHGATGTVTLGVGPPASLPTPTEGPFGSSQHCVEPPGRVTTRGHHLADLGDRVRH